jgi:hypothetical protein
MTIWKDDDPPFNVGSPKLSFLERRLYRLRRLENKRPGKFTKELKEAESEWNREFDYIWRIDSL